VRALRRLGTARTVSRVSRRLRPLVRPIAALAVALVGFPFAAHPFPVTIGAWLGWIGVALVAGALAGRPRHVWIAWLALALMAGLAHPLGWDRDLRAFWRLSATFAVLLATLGFLAGTLFGGRAGAADELRARWTGIGRTGRLATIGIVVVVVLGLVGYGGYAFVVGGRQYVEQKPGPGPCDNPGTAFGWAFEPVNYDPTGEPTALDPASITDVCARTLPAAGSEVVSSDGVSIAGWYIPAVAGAGPGGPTVVIVHGGKTDKTDGLRYAPPFHHDYNVLIVDLRNAGQSGGAVSSGGLYEQLDLRAMIDWLERTKHPGWLAVMGNSNGASTALAEARTDDRVRALILDSMHSGVELQLGNVIEDEDGLPPWPTATAVIAGASFILGGDVTSVDPIRTITEVGARPILVTHGSLDRIDRPSESVERNVAAAVDAGVNVEVHICVGAGHGHVIDVCGTAWAQWVTAFLAAHGGI
jgi:pimeloyl-ACP methyl ester carboxylesterase